MTSRLEWIGWLLLAIGILRAALLVAHDPILGYGNQYDMYRTSACVGLYPAGDEAARGKPTMEGPIALYHLAGRGEDCYRSTEVAIVTGVLAAARALGRGSGGIRLQWIGLAKLALLAATAFLVAWALRGHAAASLAHGLVFLLVLADPVVTLWFNTLYTEVGVILTLYAAIAFICALAISDRRLIFIWLLLVVALIGLAFSREQFALLPPALILAAWPWLWYRSERTTAVVFIVAVLASLASFVLLPRPSMVKLVNRADAYLGAVVPAASSPQKALAALGLPERCAILSGASWYLQRGENVHEVCPEVFQLPSYAFLKVAAEEPEAIGRSLARTLLASQALAMPFLGTMEAAPNRFARDLPWWTPSLLDALTRQIPVRWFGALALVALLAAPLAALVAIAWARPSSAHHGASLLAAMLLSGTAIYTLLTTAFGDGLSESWRHFLPGALCLYAAAIALAAGIPFGVARWIEAPRESALHIAAMAGAAAVTIVAAIVVVLWAREQPLALGVIDAPAGRDVSRAGFTLRGWALDPFGVAGVQVEIGKLRREARYGEGSASVAWVYPRYPDAAHGNFSLDVTGDDLAQAGVAPTLRVLVRNRHGAVTEVDRRRLAIAP